MKNLSSAKISLLLLMTLVGFMKTIAQNHFEVSAPNNIKSIQLLPSNKDSFFPLIKLGEQMSLSFDDLNGDEKQYYYKVEHCDYNWKKSNLLPTEYLIGYSEGSITVYENSFNTLQTFTHYSLKIPNNDVRIKLSGNYLLSVLTEDGEVIFTRRFMVYQPIVSISAGVHKSSSVSSIDSQHNIQFSVNISGFIIDNPQNEIKIAIYQNNDWNTMLTGLKPRFISINQLIYNDNRKGNFNAGNEFLNFDTKNLKSTNNHIQQTFLKTIYHTVLFEDEMRNKYPYTYYPDIDGAYVVRTVEGEDSTIDADYSWVYFSLVSPFMPAKKVYVYGAFNNWGTTPLNEMTYDSKLGLYKVRLLLKQGFYNYKYVTEDMRGNLNQNSLCGNYFQTEDNYTVLVYYKKFGAKYEQLIGVGKANSRNLKN